MRIVSLVPHATELLFALGAGEEVIAVTHECDHPPGALTLPKVTRDALPQGLTSGEIDAAVRARTAAGQSIYELDEELLTTLRPDVIVTQALCPVCAVSYEDVAILAARLPDPRPRVIALDPHTLMQTLTDARTVAAAIGRPAAGAELSDRMVARIDRVREALDGVARPRVAALEWFDPVFVAGHWTPELIELAGGEDVLGHPGGPSVTTTWEHVAAARPEVVLAMPCGYDAARAHAEALAHAGELGGLGAATVVAVDAAAYFSRPGPRLVDGLELLAALLHPDRAPPSPGGARAVDLGG